MGCIHEWCYPLKDSSYLRRVEEEEEPRNRICIICGIKQTLKWINS